LVSKCLADKVVQSLGGIFEVIWFLGVVVEVVWFLGAVIKVGLLLGVVIEDMVNVFNCRHCVVIRVALESVIVDFESVET